MVQPSIYSGDGCNTLGSASNVVLDSQLHWFTSHFADRHEGGSRLYDKPLAGCLVPLGLAMPMFCWSIFYDAPRSALDFLFKHIHPFLLISPIVPDFIFLTSYPQNWCLPCADPFSLMLWPSIAILSVFKFWVLIYPRDAPGMAGWKSHMFQPNLHSNQRPKVGHHSVLCW